MNTPTQNLINLMALRPAGIVDVVLTRDGPYLGRKPLDFIRSGNTQH
jgi:hypothetical protein